MVHLEPTIGTAAVAGGEPVVSLKKFGTGEILPEEDDLKKTASTEVKEQSLAEVREEQQREAEKE